MRDWTAGGSSDKILSYKIERVDPRRDVMELTESGCEERRLSDIDVLDIVRLKYRPASCMELL